MQPGKEEAKTAALRSDLSRGIPGKFIPLDTDICEGKISACPYVNERSECLSFGGSTFPIKFANA
jgi:hypothetical protein